MPSPENIFLIGPMGAGKTAIGRALARELERPFHDTDIEIQSRTGVDAGFVFEKEGEAGFRKREREVIAELTRLEGVVLATGGGAVLDPANRYDLSTHGTVIHLHAGIDSQLARLRASGHRPLLDTPDPAARLRELAAVRGPLYAEIADLEVDTDGMHVGQVVRHILSLL